MADTEISRFPGRAAGTIRDLSETWSVTGHRSRLSAPSRLTRETRDLQPVRGFVIGTQHARREADAGRCLRQLDRRRDDPHGADNVMVYSRHNSALGQFRPAMLEQAINQAYGRFGGLAGTGLGLTENLITRGQNAAGLSAQAGQQTGANIGNLLTQQGQAMAGGILGQAQPFAQLAALPGQIAGVGLARGLFGGTQPAATAGTITGGSGIRLPGG